MEVDLTAVAAVIVVDICFTLGLLLLVYYWSKRRKAKAKPVTRGVGGGGRPGGESGEWAAGQSHHGGCPPWGGGTGPHRVKTASVEWPLCCQGLDRGFHTSGHSLRPTLEKCGSSLTGQCSGMVRPARPGGETSGHQFPPFPFSSSLRREQRKHLGPGKSLGAKGSGGIRDGIKERAKGTGVNRDTERSNRFAILGLGLIP